MSSIKIRRGVQANLPVLADGEVAITTDTKKLWQGQGGVNHEIGGGAASAPDASASTKGVTRLSVAPSVANAPIAVGDNDPRNANARTPTAHTHVLASITDAGTAASRSVPSTAATVATATQVPLGDDPRFTNARTPTAHTHAGTDISTGIVPAARLGTGTPSATTYLNGTNAWVTLPASGNGTVTSVGATVPSGFSVAVTNPTTTPSIAITTTLNGMLRGTGTGFEVAVAGTHFAAPSHTHTLAQITQSSALTGQVPMWTGSAWVAQAPPGALTVFNLTIPSIGQPPALTRNSYSRIDTSLNSNSNVYLPYSENASDLGSVIYVTKSDASANPVNILISGGTNNHPNPTNLAPITARWAVVKFTFIQLAGGLYAWEREIPQSASSGSATQTRRQVTANTTLLNADDLLLVDCSAGAVTVFVSDVTTLKNYTIKRIDSNTANLLKVQVGALETYDIDGQFYLTQSASPYASITITPHETTPTNSSTLIISRYGTWSDVAL